MRESFCVSRDGLVSAFEFVERAVEVLGSDTALAHRICVVVDELVGNLILHDPSLTPESRFTIEVTAVQGGVMVVLDDPGAPFDLLAFRHDEQPEIGGHGLSLIRSLARQVEYRRTASGNQLTAMFASDQP